MPQHVSGRGWRVAAWCRAGILDVVTAAIGVGILALPFLSVDVIVTEGRAFLGRDVALQPWVALPVMAAYAFFSNLLYAAIGALLRQWLAQGRRLLWFNRAMAGVLTATAAWMTTA